MVMVLPGGGMSHPTATLNLSKSHMNFKRERDLMPVQGDACVCLRTELDYFSFKKNDIIYKLLNTAALFKSQINSA